MNEPKQIPKAEQERMKKVLAHATKQHAQMEATPKDRANEAFKIVIQAVDLAMKDEFPKGIDAVESLMQIKGALQYVAGELKKLYPDPDEDAAVEAGIEQAKAELETVPAEPNTPEPAVN